MAKFRVSFIQHNIHSYIVEADNGEEAKEKAYDMFLDEMCWFKPDIDCDKIEVEELNDIEPIDSVQVLHDISLCRRPTPVSEFESGFNDGLNQAMWEITHAPTLTQPNEPLTLEQLREMEGKPVWVERNEEPYDGKWYIVDYADTKNPDKTLYTKEGVTYSDYSKYFTAYAYPPAHIEREAWEPCNDCILERTKGCETCKNDNVQTFDEPCISCRKLSNWERGSNYCKHCGRPLTEEAWEELEKRVRGEK